MTMEIATAVALLSGIAISAFQRYTYAKATVYK